MSAETTDSEDSSRQQEFPSNDWLDRWLFLPRMPHDGKTAFGPLLTWLTFFLLIHLIVRNFEDVTTEMQPTYSFFAGCLFVVGLGLFAIKRIRSKVVPACACIEVVGFLLELPAAANHAFVEALTVTFVGSAYLCDSREKSDEFEQASRNTMFALRWWPILLMLWTGINKLIYRTYFDGAYLAEKLRNEPRFQNMLAPFMNDGELERITSAGDGPFYFQSIFLILLSNSVYITEILAGGFLLFRKTRILGLITCMAVIVAIEVFAREITFGIFFVLLVSTYTKLLENRFVRAILLCGYFIIAGLLASRIAGWPEAVSNFYWT